MTLYYLLLVLIQLGVNWNWLGVYVKVSVSSKGLVFLSFLQVLDKLRFSAEHTQLAYKIRALNIGMFVPLGIVGLGRGFSAYYS